MIFSLSAAGILYAETKSICNPKKGPFPQRLGLPERHGSRPGRRLQPDDAVSFHVGGQGASLGSASVGGSWTETDSFSVRMDDFRWMSL